ncbi:MAG: hypothetical protein ACQKBY_08540 [Verrucomicrobiales bacterium]
MCAPYNPSDSLRYLPWTFLALLLPLFFYYFRKVRARKENAAL